MAQATLPERHWGRITDDAIRAVRARIGIPVKGQGRQFYEQITIDNVRNFALATGDTNPLYTDRAHARASRWGAVVAPGTILFSTGVQEGRPVTAREREEGRGGALPGVHGMFSGADFELYLPMKEGDEISYVKYLADVQVK